MFYSFIIPVYNRPDHIEKLLNCLVSQTYKNFEVLVIESGSTIKSDEVVATFADKLNIRYIFKGNDGQGYSRNRGMQEAKGEYFVILDSDIVMPDSYLETVNESLKENYLDSYGGPDELHPESTDFQKAVNFCMTSLLTTGGTRGKKSSIGKYYPRSFNMGVSREVYETTKGFSIPFMGEDIEWSQRIIAAGFKTGLIEDAYVNHERKGTLKGYFNQLHFFGRARINISQLIPGSFKIVHLLPVAYCAYSLLLIFLFATNTPYKILLFVPFLLYNFFIRFSASAEHKSLKIGFTAVLLANTLMLAYCTGMLKEFYKLYVLKKKQTYKL
ncbi:glycosyltransferase [Arcticibacterium luteifluviistationis]|uniref:Glycosyltransferase n=1 Tax=Arcticibacterium luteifluviistationis TaxID=1784714 RepID=A0A2Z4GI45_9BACT|nr:glycosyltransferase [Arcticibacterium luteifluviistationis]AWW00646.1 glycosyltransferase [Arcticibacterium luteifluviistationis]